MLFLRVKGGWGNGRDFTKNYTSSQNTIEKCIPHIIFDIVYQRPPLYDGR